MREVCQRAHLFFRWIFAEGHCLVSREGWKTSFDGVRPLLRLVGRLWLRPVSIPFVFVQG